MEPLPGRYRRKSDGAVVTFVSITEDKASYRRRDALGRTKTQNVTRERFDRLYEKVGDDVRA